MLAERLGGTRALARALTGEGTTDLEPTVRRWFTLAAGEPRPIADLNRIVARLAKFCRSEIRKMHRRIRTEAGPGGDRQSIIAYLSALFGEKKPAVLTPEETLAIPVAFAAVAILALIIGPIMDAASVKSDNRSVSAPE
jgi:hypothetical protein